MARLSRKLVTEVVLRQREEAEQDNARAEAELDAQNPCAWCGKPTIRGLNTDFCSSPCEGAWHDEADTQGSIQAGV